MKTKQEQIAEIKQVLIKTCKRCRSFEEDYMQSKYAEALYNAGYRKILENAVVLTKEEYDDLKVAADNYDPFWFCSFDGCEGARKGCKDDCEMSIFVQERKKTAKEILSKLNALMEQYHYKSTAWRNCANFIKERYGLEVEE